MSKCIHIFHHINEEDLKFFYLLDSNDFGVLFVKCNMRTTFVRTVFLSDEKIMILMLLVF